jgi:hypothetical protein
LPTIEEEPEDDEFAIAKSSKPRAKSNAKSKSLSTIVEDPEIGDDTTIAESSDAPSGKSKRRSKSVVTAKKSTAKRTGRSSCFHAQPFS